MDRLQHIDRLLHTALLLTSYAIPKVVGPVAVTARNNHSGTADWFGKNLNALAKAVANKKTPLYRDGVFKIRRMLINCSANRGG
jgi:hypothetical protein